MAFRINTNVTALGALRNVNNTQDLVNQSITRLSTGLRINSAADDPAGLIAAKRFQAQIDGLGQAINNAQDGINYAKTAEGALDEVNGLLNDARTLAVQSANTGVQSSAQLQAAQQQLKSIASSIDRISVNTQFGTKKLLDGSSGTVSAVTDASKLTTVNIGGTFGGVSLTQSNSIVVTVTQAATQASLTSVLLTFATSTVAAGNFTLNGVTFSTTASTTVQNIVDQLNGASAQTGIFASFDAANKDIKISTAKYGSAQTINLVDANGVLKAAGTYTASGTDALATVGIGATTAFFTGSKNGQDGLNLTDGDGNTLGLTVAGNSVAVQNATVGQVQVGSAQFQIGANAGQTVNLSLGNYASNQIGNGIAAGVNLSNIDLTTSAGASQAIQVIDAAIDQITRARGSIGNFQRNVLESNVRSLGVAQENLSATLSNIQDTDVASETTNLTKRNIILQAGLAVLSQANSNPQQVLSLLRG